MENDLKIAVENWIAAVTTQILAPQINDQWVRDHGCIYKTLEIKELTKFIRIESVTIGPSRSAWGFVAKADGFNKQLGNYRKGDIFKSAGWATPARHARGNVFVSLPLCRISSAYGPDYLR